jgi:hypothetical protein
MPNHIFLLMSIIANKGKESPSRSCPKLVTGLFLGIGGFDPSKETYNMY